MVNYILRKILGTKNERELRKIASVVTRVNELESSVEKLDQAAMQARVMAMRAEVQKGRPLDEIMPEAFALTREAGKRALGMRHFDVQLIGGAVLHSGRIAEMRTGEGKTLVATLPTVLNAIEGRGVHVVTVNDYLARRDAEWMGRLYNYLGLSWGVVVHGLNDRQRQQAYGADITYGQNNEFGFDYLRDNMKMRLRDYVQRELNFAVVDEVDSILIDEARTPLIISGPSEESTDLYYVINQVIPGLVRDRDYVQDEKHRSVALTEEGIERLEKRLGVGNLYAPEQIERLHHVEQALRAHTLYKKDFQYVVRDGEVIIVDEHTGRLMPGRRWSDGLHQAIEAKEGVKIEAENQTLASISFQNYFRMYSKLGGMTGTADTEAEEFSKIYNLDVVVVPTHRAMVREDQDDVVFKTEREKFNAVAADIVEKHVKGQPVLVGTVSIAKSEALSALLKKRGIPHEVLNAKQHEREAEIVAQAGRKGAVTIATNMAGRGTDILLGGNAEAMAKHEVGLHPPERSSDPVLDADGNPTGKWVPEPEETFRARVKAYDDALAEAMHRVEQQVAREREEVRQLGGLHIVGTERHESRRIDNQLRGRAGRQGDPGSSRFYLSLEDDLMRIFASDTISWLMDKMGVRDDEPIEHPMLTRAIADAQRRLEGQNFDYRKNVLEYDDVMNQQRRTIYAMRRRVLAAGAGLPLVEFEEDVKTRKKRRLEMSLEWSDLRERALDQLEDAVLALVAQAAGNRREGMDLELLSRLARESLGVEVSFDPGTNPSQAELELYNAAEKAYLARESAMGPEQFRSVEQWVFLQTIDALWKDHLLTMDHLRQGIGLRGYGQKDPKQEYKKEGYDLFRVMLGRLSQSVASSLLRVEAASDDSAARVEQQRRAAEARQRKVSEARAATPEEAPKPAPAATVRTGPKVGRNDPCPCGSGKKYKKCHGAGEEGAEA